MIAKPQTYRLALISTVDPGAPDQPLHLVIEGEPETWRAQGNGKQWQATASPDGATGLDLLEALGQQLAASGWQMPVCGNCRFWQGAADSAERGWSGYCSWSRQGLLPHLAVRQSVLAAACPAYQPAEHPALLEAVAAAQDASGATPGLWQALVQRLRRMPNASELAARAVEDSIVEQSGIRPGTVACLNCQGLLANLGSITMLTEKGDDWTFSVWRCRNCEAYFLNDWVDAWVRTSSLEIVEKYYRLAPQQAFEALSQIARCAYASPQNKTVETPEKAWFRQFVVSQRPVFSEVRHGK